MLNNAVQTVSVNIPGLNEYPYANLTSAAHRFAQFLFPLAEYFCIFAALASFAGKTVLFSKFGGRVRDRFLKFIEPLRVKMP